MNGLKFSKMNQTLSVLVGPNGRHKLGFLINNTSSEHKCAEPVFIIAVVSSISCVACRRWSVSSGCCCCRQMAESRRIWQQTGRVPAHGGMARSSSQEIAAGAGNREACRSALGRCHRSVTRSHGGCVMQRRRQTTQAFVLLCWSPVFFRLQSCTRWHDQRPGKLKLCTL
jgi:hypothetical protein